MKKSKSVFGIFKNKNETAKAIKAIRRLGFDDSSLTVVHPENETLPNATDNDESLQTESLGQIRKGAMMGALIGFAVVGIGAMIFAGETYPYIGVFAAPLGALAGAAFGALVGIGTPVTVGRRYGKYLKSGRSLLVVNSTDTEHRKSIEQAIDKSGGHDISVQTESIGIEKAVLEESQPNKQI